MCTFCNKPLCCGIMMLTCRCYAPFLDTFRMRCTFSMPHHKMVVVVVVDQFIYPAIYLFACAYTCLQHSICLGPAQNVELECPRDRTGYIYFENLPLPPGSGLPLPWPFRLYVAVYRQKITHYSSTQYQCQNSEEVQSVRCLLPQGCRTFQNERQASGITREATLHSLLFMLGNTRTPQDPI